jgi:hypothetical protein
MKVYTVEGARVLDLVPLEELRPPGGVYIPDLIKGTAERYRFINGPANLAEAGRSGAKFETGKFVIDGTVEVIKELSIHSDGFIADCLSTRAADRVLDDFFEWATQEFRLRERQRPAQRTYTSAMTVDFEKAVEPALGKIIEIGTLLSKALTATYGWKYEYNLHRLGFEVDPKTVPQFRQTQFFIERKVGAPFSQNRYYSLAQLPTEVHQQLLETIEREILISN